MSTKPTISVTLASLDSILFYGEAISVTLPGTEGVLTVLPHHMPMVSGLKEGDVIVRENGEEKVFPIKSGVLEISKSGMTILV